MASVLFDECVNLYVDQFGAGFQARPCLRAVLLPQHFRWMVTKNETMSCLLAVNKFMSHPVSDRLPCCDFVYSLAISAGGQGRNGRGAVSL